MYPDVEKIILVMDKLNTHKAVSLYKRYPADKAGRIIKRLEIHYTPKHGSWLDIAEIELNVMTRQCLARRIGNIAKLREALAAWEVERNTIAAKVNWRFRTADARVKLSSLYPEFTTGVFCVARIVVTCGMKALPKGWKCLHWRQVTYF